MSETTAAPHNTSTLSALDWDPSVASTLEPLRAKWKTVPAAVDRITTTQLLSWSDEALIKHWSKQVQSSTTGESFAVRGWYHLMYTDILRGKRVLDVGAGQGIDALSFARAGAHVTMLDIVADNTRLTARLARAMGIEDHAESFLMHDLDSLDALGTFDVIWCQGSLINAPFDFVRKEVQALLEHLPVGGRWIELAYPEQRWKREGSLPFDQWGSKTDGEGTPWVEWYDLPKLKAALAPATFDTVLAFNFHNDDFNWFDLVRRS